MTSLSRNRTALFSGYQPGGVFTVQDVPTHPGNIWFVDSAVGVNAVGNGMDPDQPFASLDYAVSQCTANNGDVVYLMPGHAETISTALLSPGIDIAGVKIIGLGWGGSRPTFTLTHVDANLVVTGACCWIENILVLIGVDSVVEALDIDATDTQVVNCEFRESAGFQALNMIDIGGTLLNNSDRTSIRDCKFYGLAAGAATCIKSDLVQDSIEITGNWIMGDYSTAAVSSPAICTHMLIADNVIHNVNAGDWAIELTAAATGICTGNMMYTDALATCLDPGSLMCSENYASAAVDTHAVIIPA